MKTIRKGVFETNSSSTHSISIEKIGPKNVDYGIIKNNILYPHRLPSYQFTVESDNRGYILECSNKDTKASLVCHWISAIFWEDDSENKIIEWYNYLKDKLGYNDIQIIYHRNHEYSNYSDENCYLEEDFTKEDIDKLIEVILDDTMKIVSSVIPW